MGDFKKDLEVGKAVEREFLQLLSPTDFYYGKDKKWDIKTVEVIAGREYVTTYEVKYDKRAEETGNVAVEYESRSLPSGIITSEADYWVYKIGNAFYVLPREELLHLIKKGKYYRTVVGGDDNTSKLFLFKKEVFEPYILTKKVLNSLRI